MANIWLVMVDYGLYMANIWLVMVGNGWYMASNGW